MAKSFDVCVLGAFGLDTYVYFHGGEVDFLREGHFGENLDEVGLAGGYSSRIAAALGYRVCALGYVGNDFAGRYVRDKLSSEGIDPSGLLVDPAGTKRSVNFMYSDGRRTNFYDGKGSMSTHPDKERFLPMIAASRWVHVNIVNWTRELLDDVLRLGVPMSCDLQDWSDVNDPYRLDFLQKVDVLFFSGVHLEEPMEVLGALSRRFPHKTLVCGMGKQGAAFAKGGACKSYPPASGPKPVVDTNGAGDALAVGFGSAHLLEGKSLSESLVFGQALARQLCSVRAGKGPFPPRNEVLPFVLPQNGKECL